MNDCVVLKAFEFGSAQVAEINKLKDTCKQIILELPNTKNVDVQLLGYLPKNTMFRIVGGYTEDRIQHRNINGKNSYYESSVIYSIPEIRAIIISMMAMESGLKDEWNTLHKSRYFYNKMLRSFKYNNIALGTKTENSYDDRSLRVLLSKTGVCAGFALIFKELCDRNDIPCEYVEGSTRLKEDGSLDSNHLHAWNIISTENGSKYMVDTTAGITSKNSKNADIGFCSNKLFRCPFKFEPSRQYFAGLESISENELSQIDYDLYLSKEKEIEQRENISKIQQEQKVNSIFDFICRKKEPTALQNKQTEKANPTYNEFLEDIALGKIKDDDFESVI